MADEIKLVPLSGSFLPPVAAGSVKGRANSGDVIEISVWLRRKQPGEPDPGIQGAGAGADAAERKAFADNWGASKADLDAVVAYVQSVDGGIQRLPDSADYPDLARRLVGFQGTVASLERAFGVTLTIMQFPPLPPIIVRTGSVHLPPQLQGIVLGVFGLDARPIGIRGWPGTKDKGGSKVGPPNPPTPLDIADLYKFPKIASAAHQTIGIMEFGGAYDTKDIAHYFGDLGVSAPMLDLVKIAGGGPVSDPVYDVEVTLDIEVAGALAPKATLAMYFAPHNERGWIEGIASAVHDRKRNPLILSISWGAPELGSSHTLTWSRTGMAALSELFLDAACLGLNVLASSGNDGTNCNVNDRRVHVSYPASDPHVIACGGTDIKDFAGQPDNEIAWSYGGGGISDVYPVPPFQNAKRLPISYNDGQKRRGVPDVSGYAYPGYSIFCHGTYTAQPVPGTSLVAAFYAGVLARLNVDAGRTLRYVLPDLYKLAPIRDINDPKSDSTTNGQGWAPGYYAGKGWDARSGLGVWRGPTQAWLARLAKRPS